jgi:NTE family protein
MSKILVLAGGSVKASYQVGALIAVAESGFRPDAIYGVSAGSMNASFLINNLGQQDCPKEQLDFVRAAQELGVFWQNNINRPDALARRRATFELGLSTLRKNFEGLLDTQPLRELLENNIDIYSLQKSPVQLKVGAVNIISGDIEYTDPFNPNFFDYVMASSAIPILMPVVNIGENKKYKAFLDGGLRDVAPIKRAINDGADEIVCIACHPRRMEGGPFLYGNLLALVDRVMDIAVNECLNADLDFAELYNNVLPPDGSTVQEGFLAGKRRIKLHIIRPQKPINLDIQDFDEEDIVHIMQMGYQEALIQLEKTT